MNVRPAPRAGFTMLEMLLALAIFAIILGMVITAMPRWQQTARIKHATQLTCTGLEFARNRANAMNEHTHFTFETSTSAPPSACFYIENFSRSSILLSNTLPKGVFFATNYEIIFTPGSRTESTGAVDIVLIASNTPTATIRVSQASATVRVIR